MALTSEATTVWNGELMTGNGTVSFDSGPSRTTVPSSRVMSAC